MYSVVVVLETSPDMEDPLTHPDLEVLNFDDTNDTQQVDVLANTTTTLVVRNEKETVASFDETLVRTRPLWLENTLSSKKRNVVPILVALEDMMSKCLGKTPKVKKLKTISRINFDVDCGNWTAEIGRPLTNEKTKDPTF